MITRLKRLVFEKGFLYTLALSFAVLVFFFGKLLTHPNSVYFGASGDGFQSYYTALYHVQHDSQLWRMEGMNYPYGEQVFFTGCQPFVTNAIKLVSHLVDISSYTLGILNLLMLFSLVGCALALYLVFKELKLPVIYASLAATAIAFLSPQIERLGGHYSLTYQFAIPLFIYLLIKFYQAPSTKRSFLIFTLVLFMASIHFYFFGFFALIALFYWAALFVSRDGQFGKLSFAIKHGFIQIVLPFVLLQLIMMATDNVHDRTAFPSGYLSYKSNLTGVFFPAGRFYTPFFENFIKPEFPEWEGYAFVGIIGFFAAVIIALGALRDLLNKEFKQIFVVSNHRLLNILFWSSLLSLALSFGLPFALKGWEQSLYYAGPLKQLRGIGRFAWSFYYIINILAFYKLYTWATTQKAWIQTAALTIALFFVSYDAYVMCRGRVNILNNELAILQDKNFDLPENQWLKGIQPDHYQAIISLPYFNWGSENVWVYTESPIVQETFITSLQTGLPTTSLISSRVSLSQTYKNVQIIKEPYRQPEIVKDFKNNRPFLVLVRPNDLSKDDKALLSRCKKLTVTPRFEVYELSVESIAHQADGLYEQALATTTQGKFYPLHEYLSSDSLENVVIKNYEDLPNKQAYRGQGCYEGKLKEYNQLFRGSIPNWKDTSYVVSFWMDDFTTDLYPRSVIELAFLDSAGNVYGTDYYNPGKNFSAIDGKWGLIEREFRLKHASDQVQVTFWQPEIPDEKMLFRADQLIIRPVTTTVYQSDKGKSITLNNRTYFKK